MALHQTWVVEFEGEEMGVSIPEKKGGGVQVKVIAHGEVYTAAQFAEKHKFPVPLAEDAGDPELPFEYE